ncbi:hypothetical protein [Dongia sedimenti]|uniref:Uncharacterized protein n=1 Tax=Dongia sedimenti TaxID=3064282 RepID=A0ABU0YV85_9PROT|nr:hypothetical protein [Rhodospirillaceae bacterium R-7]
MSFRNASVKFIESNPVTAAMDRRVKIADDQRDAELNRAANEASFFRTVGLAPLERQKWEADAKTAGINADIAGATKADKIRQSMLATTQADISNRQAEENLDFSQKAHPLQVGGYAADLQSKQSQARVDTATEADKITQQKNDTTYSGLRNNQIAGEISHQQDTWNHDKETWNLDRPGAVADALSGEDKVQESFIRLAASRGIDAALAKARQYGQKVDPEIEQIFRNPTFATHAAQIYGALTVKAPGDSNTEVAWRATEFVKAAKAIGEGKSVGEVISQMNSGPEDFSRRAKARDQAIKTLTGDERNRSAFLRKTPQEQEQAIQDLTETYLRQPGDAPPAAPAQPSAGSNDDRPWWQFWGGSAAGPSASGAPQGLRGQGSQASPWEADSQSQVDWFKQSAPAGSVMIIDGQTYTK